MFHVVFDNLVQQLNKSGLPAEWYLIPSYSGYKALTGGSETDVYCLEALLGPSHSNPGYNAHAVAQVFLPRYPSLVLITMVEARIDDRQPSTNQPKYTPALDKKFSRIFLRAMHTAFNSLDPTGQQRGLLVQSYHSKITVGDLFWAGLNTRELLFRFKRDGQLAQIAVDYDDPLTTIVANAMRPFMGLIGDVHYIPRTVTPSTITIPFKNPDGGFYSIGDNSTALDRGFEIAQAYFDRHYQAFGVAIPLNNERL